MSKAKVYYKQKTTKQSPKYTGSIQRMFKSANKMRGTNKKIRPPRNEPTKSTKYTTEEEPKTKNNLDQSHILQRKL